MFYAIILIKRDTLQETIPVGNKMQHAHVVEDDEPTKKRFRREKDDSDEEYVLILALTSTISHGSNDWLVDSGASKHMTEYQ